MQHQEISRRWESQLLKQSLFGIGTTLTESFYLMLINAQNKSYSYIKKEVLNKTKRISLVVPLTKPSTKYFNSINLK